MNSLDQFGIIFCKLFSLLNTEEKIKLYSGFSKSNKEALETFGLLMEKYRAQLATVPVSESLLATWKCIKKINGIETNDSPWNINLN